ncbi:MAG TPA: hypothetical protein GX729_06590 [Firmicutes bacterium]|nr:hypothetical protein [Bacillota bacterium]
MTVPDCRTGGDGIDCLFEISFHIILYLTDCSALPRALLYHLQEPTVMGSVTGSMKYVVVSITQVLCRL